MSWSSAYMQLTILFVTDCYQVWEEITHSPKGIKEKCGAIKMYVFVLVGGVCVLLYVLCCHKIIHKRNDQ